MQTIHLDVAGRDVELPAEILELAERLSCNPDSTLEEKVTEFLSTAIAHAKEDGDVFAERLAKVTARQKRYCEMEGVGMDELDMRETQRELREWLHDLGVEDEEGDELP